MTDTAEPDTIFEMRLGERWSKTAVDMLYKKFSLSRIVAGSTREKRKRCLSLPGIIGWSTGKLRGRSIRWRETAARSRRKESI
jgi:hypothetical protein